MHVQLKFSPVELTGGLDYTVLKALNFAPLKPFKLIDRLRHKIYKAHHIQKRPEGVNNREERRWWKQSPF